MTGIRERRFVFSLPLILCLGAALLLWGCKKTSVSNSLETTITEADFKTDAERIAFLQQFLPVDVAAEASGIRFEYVSWLDWTLKATFSLPQEGFDRFNRSLAMLQRESSTRVRFDDEKKQSAGTIEVVPGKREVRIICSNPPPK